MVAKAQTRDNAQAQERLTAVTDGCRRIVADPPLVVPIADLLPDVERVELTRRMGEILEVRDDAVGASASAAARLPVGGRCAQGRRGGQRWPRAWILSPFVGWGHGAVEVERAWRWPGGDLWTC